MSSGTESSAGGGPPRANTDFCQAPSEQYERALDLCDDDPRVLAGLQALAGGDFAQPVDARESSNVPFVDNGFDPIAILKKLGLL
jgi:hypothetical protein